MAIKKNLMQKYLRYFWPGDLNFKSLSAALRTHFFLIKILLINSQKIVN